MNSHRRSGRSRWDGRDHCDSDEDRKVKQNSSNSEFYCKICDADMQSEATWLQHITGKKHLKKVQKEESGGDKQAVAEPKLQSEDCKPLIQKTLDKIQEPVLGLNHVVEIRKGCGNIIYKCELCLSVDSSSSVVDHVISMRHLTNVIKKIDPGALELINSMKLSKPAKTALIEEKASELEAKEGRGKMQVKREIIEKVKVPDKRPRESDEKEPPPNKKVYTEYTEELSRSLISYPIPAAQHSLITTMVSSSVQSPFPEHDFMGPSTTSVQAPFPAIQHNFMGPGPAPVQAPFPAVQHDFMGPGLTSVQAPFPPVPQGFMGSMTLQTPFPAAPVPPKPSIKDIKFYRMETKLKMLEELSRKVVMTASEAETVVNVITKLSQAMLEYKIDALISKEEVLQRSIEDQEFKLRSTSSRSAPGVWLNAQPYASQRNSEAFHSDGRDTRMSQRHHEYSFKQSHTSISNNTSKDASRMWFQRTF